LFRHALIRRAITDELLSIELADLHARIARRLETQEPSNELVARLAHHYWMAGERDNAEHYNVRAAQSAAALYAYDDAAMLYERAIGERPIDAATQSLYAALAQTYISAGRYRQAAEVLRKLFEYARDCGEPEFAARTAIDLSRWLFHALDHDGCIAAVRDGLALIDPARNPELAFELHGLLGWHLVHFRDVDEAGEALRRALPLYEHGSPVAQVRYHEARAAYEVHALGGGCWQEEMERGLSIARSLEPKEQVRRYLNAVALAAASEIDAFDVALKLIEECRAIIAAHPGLDHEAVLDTAAWMMYTCGRLTETRQLVDALLPYVSDAPHYAFRVASIGIPLALRTGDELLLRACARPRLLQEAFASNAQTIFGPVAAAVAEQMLAQGRTSEAAALIERTMHRLTAAGNNFDLLLLAARTGSQAVADRAEALLREWESRSRSARACMSLFRAYRSKGSKRIEYAQAAAAGFADLAWPLYRAQALELAGDARGALEIYRTCGAAADVLRIERQSQTPVAGGLSKRELEVASLVSQGNSNRAIAEELVLSERTVENHIASIFAKLNVRSRAEIAAFMARESSQAST
jgi:DNA-binding NarL/FixJ family response regulator/streptomycin 6-kinase